MLSLQVLDRRIRQMHEALAELVTPNTVVAESGQEPEGFYIRVNFDLPDTEIFGIAETLVFNIARIKDHLHAWCRQPGRTVQRDGDALIDTQRSVALVHDLWNMDKHAIPGRRHQPRSGHWPELRNLHRVLALGGGMLHIRSFSVTGGSAPMGPMQTHGEAELIVSARIVDANTNADLGDFATICEEAVGHWEVELRAAGVAVPTR